MRRKGPQCKANQVPQIRPALERAWKSLQLLEKHDHSLLVTLPESLLSARLTLKYSTWDNSFISPPTLRGGSYDYPHFANEEMETQVKPFVQGHRTHKWQGWDLNPSSLAPVSALG